MSERTGFSRENGYGTHAPRTGMAGEVGELRALEVHRDGSPMLSSIMVCPLEAKECDFWLCTLRDEADNEDHFLVEDLTRGVPEAPATPSPESRESRGPRSES